MQGGSVRVLGSGPKRAEGRPWEVRGMPNTRFKIQNSIFAEYQIQESTIKILDFLHDIHSRLFNVQDPLDFFKDSKILQGFFKDSSRIVRS